VNSLASVDRFLKHRRFPSNQRRESLSFSEAAAHRRWKLGTQVRHAKYGLGTVIECEGEGEDTKLTVSFPGYGRKKLVERYAALEKA
jgi:DNA helicase-2/ATP-dependent DNA helicase PcrA